MFCFRCSLVIIFCLKHELMVALNVRKFVYQKDISEHCRRRVMPSVFLGRHVVDANSQILHFTRLELPYSCFISVRSESGTNIILVIEMVLEDDITSSCSKNGNQLLVYEMSETFGGYWGPLSDSIIKRDRVNDTKFYTLKTTQPTEPSTLDTEEYDDAVETSAENVDTKLTTKSDDSEEYIRMELPIVNVSGKLIPGENPRKNVYDIDDSFDFLYDVTPRPGFSYDTSIIPLVQFAIKKTIGIQRKSNHDESKYGIGYNLKPVTPDERLLLSTRFVKTNKYKIHKYNVNSRLNFKTSKSPIAAYRRHSYIKKPLTTQQHILTNPSNIITMHETTSKSILSINEKTHGNISWDFIDGLMKSFGTTASITATTTDNGTSKEVYKNMSNLFQKILDTRNNSSVYLLSNLSMYYKDVPLYASVIRTSTTNEKAFQFIKGTESNLLMNPTKSLTRNTKKMFLSEVTKALHTVYNSSITNITSSLYEDQDLKKSRIIATMAPTLIVGNSTTSSSSISKRNENLTGSLVDRESWDNVVQAAPVMAVILHQLRSNQSHSTHDLKVTNRTKRIKRYIESVPVENARPHNITIRRDPVTTPAAKYDVADMQDFAQLVEIQDDELHGRVALRYLRRYVGPTLLNICDTTDTATRYVYLFNSSRIVLAISNFTMNSMTVIVTPAQTVMTGDGRCSADRLECQVSGARVCIDSLTACDGIPNCGSYDIYDEDRLMCGAAIGLRHNVYLAAFTFLAVLLTVLYGVHYWLRRCVPKVSDAFFLYTDGTENVLYLDTIMRSPADDDDASKIAYRENILDDDLLLFSEVNEGKRSNKFKRFFKCLFTCSLFRKNTKKQDAYDKMAQEGLYATLDEQKKRYSYAEIELRKILDAERVKNDIAVQTGDSLEMTNLEGHKIKNQYGVPHKLNTCQSLLNVNDYSSFQVLNNQPSPDELSILNFFNNSKSDSSKSQSSDETVKIKALARRSITLEEKEIKSHTYDHKAKKENVATTSTLPDSNIFVEGSADRIKKHLRFEERTTTIPSDDHDGDSDDYENENFNRRRSVVLGIGKTSRTRDLDSIQEGEESVGNIQANSIRFWGKSKKPKK